MSFLYNRTITVWRLPTENGAGDQGNVGPTATNLVQVGGSGATMPATVQEKKDSGGQPAKLPGDISKRTYWMVITPPGVQTIPVQSNDEIHDDLGRVFQVVGSYPTSFANWQLMCERVEI